MLTDFNNLVENLEKLQFHDLQQPVNRLQELLNTPLTAASTTVALQQLEAINKYCCAQTQHAKMPSPLVKLAASEKDTFRKGLAAKVNKCSLDLAIRLNGIILLDHGMHTQLLPKNQEILKAYWFLKDSQGVVCIRFEGPESSELYAGRKALNRNSQLCSNAPLISLSADMAFKFSPERLYSASVAVPDTFQQAFGYFLIGELLQLPRMMSKAKMKIEQEMYWRNQMLPVRLASMELLQILLDESPFLNHPALRNIQKDHYRLIDRVISEILRAYPDKIAELQPIIHKLFLHPFFPASAIMRIKIHSKTHLHETAAFYEPIRPIKEFESRLGFNDKETVYIFINEHPLLMHCILAAEHGKPLPSRLTLPQLCVIVRLSKRYGFTAAFQNAARSLSQKIAKHLQKPETTSALKKYYALLWFAGCEIQDSVLQNFAFQAILALAKTKNEAAKVLLGRILLTFPQITLEKPPIDFSLELYCCLKAAQHLVLEFKEYYKSLQDTTCTKKKTVMDTLFATEEFQPLLKQIREILALEAKVKMQELGREEHVEETNRPSPRKHTSLPHSVKNFITNCTKVAQR